MQPILRIDLSTNEHETLPIPVEWVHDYLGAASLAARFLFPVLTAALDPLSPEAPLLFLNGPLTGTAGPAVGRFVVCGKSPATGLWGEANAGGFWGPELRKAGFDGLWIQGQAPGPVYLLIADGVVSIRSAEKIWGLDTYATQTAIQEEIGLRGVRIAAIGPAGERRIPFASILCDHGRVAGRTGMGAVMGSKNLKAVAVHGSGDIPLVDWTTYNLTRGRANRALKQHNQSIILRELGSAGGADYFDYLGELPKKYFQLGAFPGAAKTSGSAVKETILSGVSTCHACVIACGRVVTLEDGQPRKGPEYETLAGFGPNLWIDDPAVITRLGELCDRFGMDSISASNTIGLAFELFEIGALDLQSTGGMALEWGDSAAAEYCVRQIVQDTEFGARLALGARGLGRAFGDEERAVQVNGLEVPYHDPRAASGMALVYATSPRGACHNQSDFFMVDIGQCEEELGIQFHPRQAGGEKAAMVARHQDWRTVNNALVLCIFANVLPSTVMGLVESAVGVNYSIADLLRCGERAWNLKRLINIGLGLRREHDRLPRRLLQPMPDGGSAGFVPNLEEMLGAYYTARGWDPQTGIPLEHKLIELDLTWASPNPL